MPRTRKAVHPLVEQVLTEQPQIAKLVGFTLERIGEGRAAASMEAGPQHANPMGTLHGGILCDLADAAMGMAFVSTLSPQEGFTTIQLNITFFRPVWKSTLRAEARVTNRGKNIGYVECDITDENGKRIAAVNSTCFILRGAGRGRVRRP